MFQKIFIGALIGGAIGATTGYFGKCSSGVCPLTANPYTGALYGAVMGVMITVILSEATKNPGHIPGSETREMLQSIDKVTDETFNEKVLQSNLPVVVDFWSPTCRPCRKVSPIIAELGEDYGGKIKVYKMNVASNEDSAERYDLKGIPAVLFFKNGQELRHMRIVGARDKEAYQKVIEELVGINSQE